jgi:hypothetical protein
MVSGSNEAFNARHRTLLLRSEYRGWIRRPGRDPARAEPRSLKS